MAFKKSTGGGGMSIFDRACAEATSGVICSHIAQFYPNVGGDPAVFYILKDNELPQGSEIIETLSDTDDACHREVIGVGNGALKTAFKTRTPDQFHIWVGQEFRPLEEADIAAFE